MNKKILVVDDDEGILNAISLILEESGYEVDTITRGEQTYKRTFYFLEFHLIILYQERSTRFIIQFTIRPKLML